VATVPYLNCPRPIRTVDCLITHLSPRISLPHRCLIFAAELRSFVQLVEHGLSNPNGLIRIQVREHRRIIGCTSYPYEIISAPDTDPYSVNVTSIDANDVRHSVRALRILRLECGI
jgi:hypothetical protein